MSDRGEDAAAPPLSDWLAGSVFRLWKANQLVSRTVASALEGVGAKMTQLGILVHLDALGAMSASELARLFSLTPQSTTAALAQLEAVGWTTRQPHPTHRKVVLHDVTPAGRLVAEEGRRRVGMIDAEVVAVLTPEQETVLRRVTDVLIAD